MIVAVGIDLIELARIRHALGRFGDRFTGRVFHPDELAGIADRTDPVPGLAARFAAKEAFQKCWPQSFGWRDVWVTKNGVKPVLCFSDSLAAQLEAADLAAHLSLTHARDHAAAVVVLERRGG